MRMSSKSKEGMHSKSLSEMSKKLRNLRWSAVMRMMIQRRRGFWEVERVCRRRGGKVEDEEGRWKAKGRGGKPSSSDPHPKLARKAAKKSGDGG